MDKEPITSQGLNKLKKELEELKNIRRPKIVGAIAEARGHGDLKENAEYHAAKEEQAKIEGRIIEISGGPELSLLAESSRSSIYSVLSISVSSVSVSSVSVSLNCSFNSFTIASIL